MAKYKAIDIAKWFVYRNEKAMDSLGGDKMTLLKLLKLLYYAEGSSLALDNGSLFDDPIVAWEHGPVVESVYYYYPSAFNVSYNEEMDMCSISKIEEKDKEILEEVFQVFGAYSAWALRNKTHEETPWLETTKHGTRLKGEIDRKLIEDYFRETYIA